MCSRDLETCGSSTTSPKGPQEGERRERSRQLGGKRGRVDMGLATGEGGKRACHMGDAEGEDMWAYLQKAENWHAGGALMSGRDHPKSLCVGSLNLRQFLCRTESLVHGDSGHILASMMSHLKIELFALQEMGLTSDRLKYVQQQLIRQDLHLIVSTCPPRRETCGLVMTTWWAARRGTCWRHASGRAMIQDFVLPRGQHLAVLVVYGFTGAGQHPQALSNMNQLLNEIKQQWQLHRHQNAVLIDVGDFNVQ